MKTISEKIAQIKEIRVQAEELGFFKFADHCLYLEKELEFRLGMHNVMYPEKGKAKRSKS